MPHMRGEYRRIKCILSLKRVHNPNFYEQILLKIKEKDNLIKKTLQDLSNLKYLFENNALHEASNQKKMFVKNSL